MILEERHYKAARIIARGGTREAAAKEAGVSERTLYNWLGDPDFVNGCFRDELEIVTQARASALPPLVMQLTEAVSNAVAVMAADPQTESDGLRRNLEALVAALVKVVELERSDSAATARAQLPRAKGPDGKPLRESHLAETVGLGAGLMKAADAAPRVLSEAESNEENAE